jgi:hypothetical protein
MKAIINTLLEYFCCIDLALEAKRNVVCRTKQKVGIMKVIAEKVETAEKNN